LVCTKFLDVHVVSLFYVLVASAVGS
jgi:hypothetical protein